MGLFDKVRKYAALASANFEAIFKETSDIPPLPVAAAQLVEEIYRPEPDIERLGKIISSTPGLAAKVIKTVNSALFSLRHPVTSVRHAVTMLGLIRIREIALVYTVLDSLPRPREELFDHEAFWVDSLSMAMLAESFTRRYLPGQEDEAFTASLLSDMALPILLSSWEEYYTPILEEWRAGPARLSEIEREHFGWDHGQAGAWIAKSWNLGEKMACFIGSHNLGRDAIGHHELDDTIALPVALASLAPSVMRPEYAHPKIIVDSATEALKMTTQDFIESLEEAKQTFEEVRMIFGLQERNAQEVFDSLIESAQHRGEPS